MRKQISLFESKPGHFLTDPGGKAAHFAPNQQDTGLGRRVLKCLSAARWRGAHGACRGPPPPPTTQRSLGSSQVGAEVQATLGMTGSLSRPPRAAWSSRAAGMLPPRAPGQAMLGSGLQDSLFAQVPRPRPPLACWGSWTSQAAAPCHPSSLAPAPGPEGHAWPAGPAVPPPRAGTRLCRPGEAEGHGVCAQAPLPSSWLSCEPAPT